MFKVGDKVVCVNDQWQLSHMANKLKKGLTYTIEAFSTEYGPLAIFLKEHYEMNATRDKRICHRSDRFRRLTFGEESVEAIVKEIKKEKLQEV